MTDIAALKATPPSGFRYGVFANSVDITHVESGQRLGSFPTHELAQAFLYALIDYRGASPMETPDRRVLRAINDLIVPERYDSDILGDIMDALVATGIRTSN